MSVKSKGFSHHSVDDLKDELLFTKQLLADHKLQIQSLKVRLLKMEEAVRIKDNQIEYLMDPKTNPKLGQMISGKAINIIMELRRRNKHLKQLLVEQEISMRRTTTDDEEKEGIEGTVDEVNSNFLNDTQSHLSCKSPESSVKFSVPQEDEDTTHPGHNRKASSTLNVGQGSLQNCVVYEEKTEESNVVDLENQKSTEEMSKERDLILKLLVEKDDFNQSLICKIKHLEKLVKIYSESLYGKCNQILSKERVYSGQQKCKSCSKIRKNSPKRNQREQPLDQRKLYLRIDQPKERINRQEQLSPDFKVDCNNSSPTTARPNSDSRKSSARSLTSRFGKKYFQNLSKVYSVQKSFGENIFNRKCRSSSYKMHNKSQESKKIKK